MERETSDKEEEDQQNLIAQSERGNNRSESPVCTTFQIDDVNDETANPRRFNFSFSKWYFLAIIVPVFILILYFTTDVDNLFGTSFVNANYNVSVNRMRESELRALYLLRQRQLGLFKLSNSTLLDNSLNATSNKAAANNSNFVSTSSFSSALFEELKLNLLSQISLNKQIQQALLSSHQLGNLLNASYNATDSSFNDYGGLHRCRKMDYRLSERRTIEWKSRSTAPIIYLSTNAAESETDLLQLLVIVYGKTVPLVRRPARNSDEK
ncbi:hypothetical protein HAX54_025495 [Datura stramonium]|uniref:Uncharacterized protein n=1 Tax=Datura stramonium TaxID=4076 RepID=A0ABS8UZW4_DATST|nr:hypothetical protein [Datura stramonium]